MSEARANANANQGSNINGGASAPVHVGAVEAPPEFPNVLPGQNMRVPENEAEADALLRAQFGNDPNMMRAAAQATFQKLQRLAEQMEKESAPVAPPIAAVPETAPVASPIETVVHAEMAQAAPVEVPAVPVVAAPAATVPVSAPAPVQAPAAPPARPALALDRTPAAAAAPWPPPGYLPVPEGLFTWTPETWGGRPLHCVPDHAIERDRQATILIVILMQEAYARNRAGRVVSLPPGARVAIHAGVAWGPVMPLAKGPEGRPVICARPSLDGNGRPIVYDLGDGAREWGLEITFDPDPKNPGFPRLIDIQTVKGARHDSGGE